MKPRWITNDPETAARLRFADAIYADARRRALLYPLQMKIEAYRKAREERDATYRAIANEVGSGL